MTRLLPTTIAGSLPKPSWLAAPEVLWAPWRLAGEQSRQHFVHGFLAGIDGVTCTTAVHICYGYGIEANIAWKRGLGDEGRQYELTFPHLARSRIDQVSLECARSRVPMSLLSLLEGKDVLAGCIDVASPQVETPEEVAEVIREALRHVAPERLQPCTNCGMAPLPRHVARAKLRALAAGAALVREELGAEAPAAASAP